MNYPIVIRDLPEEDGGGFLAYAPDLKGCMTTGDTQEEVLADIKLAIDEWRDAWTQMGREMPEPHSAAKRARAEHESILKAVAELSAKTDDVEAKLEQLRRDFEEHLETLDSWDRFESIAGVRAPALPFPATERPALVFKQ